MAWLVGLLACLAWRWRDGFHVAAEAEIGAPHHAVWRRVHHMGQWSAWNSVFNVSIDGLPTEGKPLVVACAWYDGATDAARERITHVEPPSRRRGGRGGRAAPSQSRLCWDYEGLPDWLLGTDRCIELREAGRGRTRLRNYEGFYGPLAPFVWLHRRAHIQQGFHAFNRDLGCLLAPRECAADLPATPKSATIQPQRQPAKTLVIQGRAEPLPPGAEKFCYRWCQVANENGEAYLAEIGLSWPVRKVALSVRACMTYTIEGGVLHGRTEGVGGQVLHDTFATGVDTPIRMMGYEVLVHYAWETSRPPVLVAKIESLDGKFAGGKLVVVRRWIESSTGQLLAESTCGGVSMLRRYDKAALEPVM